MGEDVEFSFSRQDRLSYREKLKSCLGVLERMLATTAFETGRTRVGLENEFYVVDADGTPLMVNEQLLEKIESDDFQTELAQFNIEFNLPPRLLTATALHELEDQLGASVDHADQRAADLGGNVAMIGILPTLGDLHVTVEHLSRNPRYHLLNEQILAMRGEDLTISIEGDEQLVARASSIMFEAAATSVQLHIQVDPDAFAATWNAAQAIAAAQVAVGCNSPFFLGKRLWQETRIALFEQSIDTRPQELAAQGVRPRVWFGERWISSVTDLFDENVRYFPALLPLLDDQDPEQAFASGAVPHLKELTLHNGTIYRWNRPVYDAAGEQPHLRVENRVLPAGPTVVDAVANAAFFFGLVHAIAGQESPVTSGLDFEVATDNFFTAARNGLASELAWPGLGTVPAAELIADHLLPLADQGLADLSVDRADRERYLGIVAERCRRMTTGAEWQVATFRALHDRGIPRWDALVELTRRYLRNMRSGEPVHAWPRP